LPPNSEEHKKGPGKLANTSSLPRERGRKTTRGYRPKNENPKKTREQKLHTQKQRIEKTARRTIGDKKQVTGQTLTEKSVKNLRGRVGRRSEKTGKGGKVGICSAESCIYSKVTRKDKGR